MSRYYVLWIFIYLSVQFRIMTTKGCAQLFEKKLKKLIKDKHVKRKNGQCMHVQISYNK